MYASTVQAYVTRPVLVLGLQALLLNTSNLLIGLHHYLLPVRSSRNTAVRYEVRRTESNR